MSDMCISRRWKIGAAIVALLAIAPLLGTARAADATVQANQEVGRWHLEVVRQSWASDRHLMKPLPTVGMGDKDKDHPGEYEGNIADPNHKIDYENAYGCGPGDAPPQTNPCAFVDYVNLTQIDDHTVHYHIRNHGGRGVISLHIFQHDPVKQTESGPDQPWILGASFVVMVPSDAVDSTVVGKMGANNIFFTPSSPLTGDDAKRFALIETKKIDGVGTYYNFRVVNPYP